MAFYGGEHWLRDAEKVALLDQIVKKGIHLRVLVNTQESIENIFPHLRQRRREYMEIDKAISVWKQRWESDFPGILEVRVSDIPLLHRVYLIRKKDGTGAAHLTCYTYGNYSPEKDFKLSFGKDAPEFSLFANEFDYLWEHAKEG